MFYFFILLFILYFTGASLADKVAEGIPVISPRSVAAALLATAAEGTAITSPGFICALLKPLRAFCYISFVHSFPIGGHVRRGHGFNSSWDHLCPLGDQNG
jgi:hypothetical protein